MGPYFRELPIQILAAARSIPAYAGGGIEYLVPIGLFLKVRRGLGSTV